MEKVLSPEGATRVRIAVTVNGEERQAEIEPRMLLVHFLRDVLGLTGAHIGCVIGRCGCCTVHWNGRAVKSCMVYAVQTDGTEVLTVEGLAGEPTCSADAHAPNAGGGFSVDACPAEPSPPFPPMGERGLHPLQQAFWQEDAVECGYCTSGMLMAAYGLLRRNPTPTDEEITQAISGNLCRCTGYSNIVAAIRAAGDAMAEA